MKKLNILIKELNNFSHYNINKDFLLTQNQSKNTIKTILIVAQILKQIHKNKTNFKVFNSGLAVSIFKDKSTRTKFAYSFAANFLGLNMVDFDEEKSQIIHGETLRETAVMTSFLAKVVGIRHDMFINQGNTYMKNFGNALDEAFNSKILHYRPSIINLQCDIDHPTQSMSDLLHLKNTFGSLENLKNKKIAVTWAYSPSYGKPLSVPQGIITLMSRFGMNVVLAHPEGYDLTENSLINTKKNTKNSGGSFKIINNMNEAFLNADIVYPKSWAPLSIMKERTNLLKIKNNDNLLKSLEKECLLKNKKYENWECNEKKMGLTKNSNALYMHCLPADISGLSCKKGEVENSVFEKYRLQTYTEASYKPFIIAAIIMIKNCENIKDFLNEKLIKGKT